MRTASFLFRFMLFFTMTASVTNITSQPQLIEPNDPDLIVTQGLKKNKQHLQITKETDQPELKMITKKELFKKPHKVVQEASRLIIYADFTYDKNGQLIQKSKYVYDASENLLFQSYYILNNPYIWGYTWLSNVEDEWILMHQYSYNYNQQNQLASYTYSVTDQDTGLFHESYKYEYNYNSSGTQNYRVYYTWNPATNMLQGNNKYLSNENQEGYTILYEYYLWNDTISDWTGDGKWTSEIEYKADTVIDNETDYEWNYGTKSWDIANYKYKYTYLSVNNTLYTLSIKYFQLENSAFKLYNETIYEPYPAGRSYKTVLTRYYDGTAPANYSLRNYTYNANHKWAQVDDSRWYGNNWVNTEKYEFTYSTPDSVRTRIQYRNNNYYLINGFTKPALCSGETLYPVGKQIYKIDSRFNRVLMNYSYLWNSSYCMWTPSTTKYEYVIDDSNNVLSYTYCSQYDMYQWYGCYNIQYTYNAMNEMTTETITNSDGSVSRNDYFYINDYLLYLQKSYNFNDWNGDSIFNEYEWTYNGMTTYAYNPPFTTDSVTINSIAEGSLMMYDLTGVKKLVVTGNINSDDLKYLNNLSYSALESLDLTDATLPENTLEPEVFEETAIQTLILPKNLEYIMRDAISDYGEGLAELVIYPAIREIEKSGIQAYALKILTIPSSQFDNLYSFVEDEINLPGVVDIYKSTLIKITFNDNSGKIDDALCYNLSYLKEVEIQEGITQIGNNAFKSCGMLTSVKLPASLREIGYNAFWGCNELTSLVIPEGTTNIGYSAFWGCSGVANIEMPSSLQAIGRNAFWGCSSVNEMKVAAVLPPVLGDNALSGIPRDANLIVPAGGINLYKNTDQWKEFYKINTATETNKPGEPIVYASNNQLIIKNIPENACVKVFNIQGMLLIDNTLPGQYMTVDLEKGAYIVQIGSNIQKAVIR